MKAVIYARYSSHNQTEQSIEGQLRECYSFAEKNNISIVGTYIDRALSATTDNRPEFQKLIHDSSSKYFDTVLTYKIDRFARNRYDSAIYKARLKKNGVKVLYAKENIPDGPEGIILESLLEGMAEYYSAELSQKIKRGKIESAYKLKATGGHAPFGLKIGEDGTYIVDEVTAPETKKIFEMYADGVRIKDICNRLNSLGFKTTKNAKFTNNSLHGILKNEKYIGVYSASGLRFEDAIEPIISKELFYRVQKRIAENRRRGAKNKAKVNYLLSGKLFCGLCHGPIGSESGTSRHGYKCHYYKCLNRKKYKTCSKKIVRKEWLEKLVAYETVNHIFDENKINIIAEHCVSINENEKNNNSEIKELNAQLKTINKSLNNLLKAIENGIFNETTNARMIELENNKTKLEYEIELAKIQQPTLTKEHIIFMLEQLIPKKENLSENEIEKIIDTFVHSVYLYDDKLLVTYNMTIFNKELDSSTLENISNFDFKALRQGSDIVGFSPFSKADICLGIYLLYFFCKIKT